MEEARNAVSKAPDRQAQSLIVLIAALASLALLLLHEGIDGKWPGFDDLRLLTIAYTLAIAPPLMLALMIERIAERFAFVAISGVALLLLGLALHTGAACNSVDVSCWPLVESYVPTQIVALFILLPFLQGLRERLPGSPLHPPYAALYRHAWDNALALAATAVFALIAWLILWLWAALFALVGIPEFRELFNEPRFYYPVTGLITGFGLVLSRAQGGALRALLRLCLSLCRALLPFIALLALLFLAVVLVNGPETLWKTGRAASLLLWLVLFTLMLTNGVFQDGEADDPYPGWLRRFVNAGLLTMPIHAGLAIYAIALRVGQYGWSTDRLSAALVAAILMLHALLLAWAVLRRQGRWLAWLSTSNPVLAGVVVALLLISQSPLLDFRVISVHSQMARLESGLVKTDKFDVWVFTQDLGVPGREALERLRLDPRHAADAVLLADIDDALSSRWYARDELARKPRRDLVSEDFAVLPEGLVLPSGLLAAVQKDLDTAFAKRWGGRGCVSARTRCLLQHIDLGGSPGDEWLLVPFDGNWGLQPLVYAEKEGVWAIAAFVNANDGNNLRIDAEDSTPPVAVDPVWKHLQIGNKRFAILPGRPPGLR